MKTIGVILTLFISTMIFAQEKPSKVDVEPENPDSTEYELIITETGFQSWFVTNRKPKWYHSHTYYSSQNRLYTQTWNSRVSNPAYGKPYDLPINYNIKTNYPFDLDYKLYWYFRFMEHKYNLDPLITDRYK